MVALSVAPPAPAAFQTSSPRAGFMALEVGLLLYAIGLGAWSLSFYGILLQRSLSEFAIRVLSIAGSVAVVVLWASPPLLVFGVSRLRRALTSDARATRHARRAWFLIVSGFGLSFGAAILWFFVLFPHNPSGESLIAATSLGTASGALFFLALVLHAIATSVDRHRGLVQVAVVLGAIALAAEIPLAVFAERRFDPPASIFSPGFPPWSWGIPGDALVVASALTLGLVYRGLAGPRPNPPSAEKAAPSR